MNSWWFWQRLTLQWNMTSDTVLNLTQLVERAKLLTIVCFSYTGSQVWKPAEFVNLIMNPHVSLKQVSLRFLFRFLIIILSLHERFAWTIVIIVWSHWETHVSAVKTAPLLLLMPHPTCLHLGSFTHAPTLTHTISPHRDGAASASAQCQRQTRTFPRDTHGCKPATGVFYLYLDYNFRLQLQDQDLPTQRRWVPSARRCVHRIPLAPLCWREASRRLACVWVSSASRWMERSSPTSPSWKSYMSFKEGWSYGFSCLF